MICLRFLLAVGATFNSLHLPLSRFGKIKLFGDTILQMLLCMCPSCYLSRAVRHGGHTCFVLVRMRKKVSYGRIFDLAVEQPKLFRKLH